MSALYFRRFVSASALLFAGAALYAETLSWQECLDRTVHNNLDLSIAKLKLKEAEAELRS